LDVFDVFADVDKEYEKPISKGVQFIMSPKTHPSPQRIAYFKDPEANVWEISKFLKK
jgi:uncharacterized glyoxalase superfamily protein PhnB